MMHGPGRKRFTQQDKDYILRLAPSSFKGFSFYHADDWRWLKDIGYKEVGVRIWHDQGDLPNLEEMKRETSKVLNFLLSIGINPWYHVLNEPNLEFPHVPVSNVRKFLFPMVEWSRSSFPDVETVSPPLSPSWPGAWGYYQEFKQAILAHHTQGLDYYWSSANDCHPEAAFSPAWARNQLPSMPLRLLECGGGDGTPRRWRYDTYPGMLQSLSWMPYLKSYHVFILSSDDPQWASKGHTYDEEIVKTMVKVNSLPKEIPNMPTFRIGNLDVTDLRNILLSRGAYATRLAKDIEGLVIHHVGVNGPVDAQSTANYHVNNKKWPGIGYHFFIRKDGSISYTQDWNRASFHVAGQNHKYMGICLEGDFTHATPNPNQLTSAHQLVANIQHAFGQWWEVYGHYEVALKTNPTSCPGASWPRWKSAVERRPTIQPVDKVQSLEALVSGYEARIQQAIHILSNK